MCFKCTLLLDDDVDDVDDIDVGVRWEMGDARWEMGDARWGCI